MSTTAPAKVRLKTDSLLRRVKVRDFKSIACCDVELGTLTALVGRNGSGKSNFLDALGFVADALRGSFFEALRSRDGFANVWRKGAGGAGSFSIELELTLGDDGHRAAFGFEFGYVMDSRDSGRIGTLSERLAVEGADGLEIVSYEVKNGVLARSTELPMPPVPNDRPYLANAAGLPAFRGAYDALVGMNFYQFKPEALKAKQAPNEGNDRILDKDGSNIAGVIGRLSRERPGVKEHRVLAYLKAILPDLEDVKQVVFPSINLETLAFTQRVPGFNFGYDHSASSMSDGTLRALGTLVAVIRPGGEGVPVRLVGIEEPEAGLHPAAAGVLMDALREGAVQTQVVVTTHSPDLLDLIDLETDRLLVAQIQGGATVIAGVDSASRQTVKEGLFSPGQLLSTDQLEPEWRDLERQRQAKTFKGSEGAA